MEEIACCSCNSEMKRESRSLMSNYFITSNFITSHHYYGHEKICVSWIFTSLLLIVALLYLDCCLFSLYAVATALLVPDFV